MIPFYNDKKRSREDIQVTLDIERESYETIIDAKNKEVEHLTRRLEEERKKVIALQETLKSYEKCGD